MGSTPSTRAFSSLENSNPADDFLQLSVPGGQILGWIDGTGALQGSLGSGGQQKFTVTLSSAQLLSLAAPSTGIQLLPAVPGKTYIVTEVIATMNFNTTQYATNSSVIPIAYSGTFTGIYQFASGFLGGSNSRFTYGAGSIFNNALSSAVGAGISIVNSNSSALTLGDGTVTITMMYMLV